MWREGSPLFPNGALQIIYLGTISRKHCKPNSTLRITRVQRKVSARGLDSTQSGCRKQMSMSGLDLASMQAPEAVGSEEALQRKVEGVVAQMAATATPIISASVSLIARRLSSAPPPLRLHPLSSRPRAPIFNLACNP